MPRFNPNDWTPNSMERKCLVHLDSAENWERILKRTQPPEDERLSWRPFIKIFAINLIFFLFFVAIIMTVVAVGTLGIAGVREDIVLLTGFILVVSAITAAYTTHLYRRSWNRRAAQQTAALT